MKMGKLIVIEGIDGSGKATQAALLAKNLKKTGKMVKNVAFPRYNKESSVLIREYLAGKFGTAEEVGPYQGSVFYAIDRYAESFRIRKLLDRGYWIICDRYVSSNKGHQASKILLSRDRKKFLTWLNNFEYEILKIPIPDLTIFLSLNPSLAFQNILERSKSKNIKRDLHEKKRYLIKAVRLIEKCRP